MVTTRTFCCCIPARVGVVIIAIFGLLGGGALAIAGALNAHRIDGSKVSIAISIVIYALLAFVSGLGLIGAIGRKLALIKLYFVMLLAHLVFSLGVGIYAAFRIFHDGAIFINECVAANDASALGDDPTKVCHEGLKVVKGVTLTMFIIFWLFEIWGCAIVSSYVSQLTDENAIDGVVKDTEAW